MDKIANLHTRISNAIDDKKATVLLIAKLPAGLITAAGFFLREELTRRRQIRIYKQNMLKNQQDKSS